MGVYIASAVIGIPCIAFLLCYALPGGREWLRKHDLIG